MLGKWFPSDPESQPSTFLFTGNWDILSSGSVFTGPAWNFLGFDYFYSWPSLPGVSFLWHNPIVRILNRFPDLHWCSLVQYPHLQNSKEQLLLPRLEIPSIADRVDKCTSCLSLWGLKAICLLFNGLPYDLLSLSFRLFWGYSGLRLRLANSGPIWARRGSLETSCYWG